MVINCYPSHNGNPVYRVLPPSPKLVYKHLKTIVIFLINHGIHQVSQLCYHKSALDPIRSHRNPHSSWLNQVESPCSKGVFFPVGWPHLWVVSGRWWCPHSSLAEPDPGRRQGGARQGREVFWSQQQQQLQQQQQPPAASCEQRAASSELPALPFTAMLFQVASPVFSRLRNCKLKN